MKVLTYGDIMHRGQSVFTSTARLDDDVLHVTFTGVVRVDNPQKQLQPYIDALEAELPALDVASAVLDFTELRFCNSNGFYVIMDIIEVIYNGFEGPVKVRRLKEDDWQQETLPILLDLDEDDIRERTSFEDVREI
ncbi:MAG: hypothetical protein R3F65_13495 [bacterium]|nr:hypothetical protein [Myxococcales bacterium]MCB9540969.1 hypothetical protein [Myxococcales bacterium]MCB9552579.1 hypothetical protein [Myxococcales bacterium]